MQIHYQAVLIVREKLTIRIVEKERRLVIHSQVVEVHNLAIHTEFVKVHSLAIHMEVVEVRMLVKHRQVVEVRRLFKHRQVVKLRQLVHFDQLQYLFKLHLVRDLMKCNPFIFLKIIINFNCSRL